MCLFVSVCVCVCVHVCAHLCMSVCVCNHTLGCSLSSALVSTISFLPEVHKCQYSKMPIRPKYFKQDHLIQHTISTHQQIANPNKNKNTHKVRTNLIIDNLHWLNVEAERIVCFHIQRIHLKVKSEHLVHWGSWNRKRVAGVVQSTGLLVVTPKAEPSHTYISISSTPKPYFWINNQRSILGSTNKSLFWDQQSKVYFGTNNQ